MASMSWRLCLPQRLDEYISDNHPIRVWDTEVADGRDALSDYQTEWRQHRDESACLGVQFQALDQHPGGVVRSEMRYRPEHRLLR